MKTRFGFVSNSSSSSFCIAKCYMSEKQIDGFRKVLDEFKKRQSDEDEAFDDETNIRETDRYFVGALSINDELIHEFLANKLDKKSYAIV